MRSKIIILVLAVVAIVEFISVIQMSDRASYWMNRSEAAENYIRALESDFPEYIDTTSGGDEYSEYYEYVN